MTDKDDVDRVVGMPIAPWDSNEMIAETFDRFPDRLIGFASVKPNTINVSDWHKPVKDLQAVIEKSGLTGLKLNPRVQNFSLRDLRLISTFSCEAERGIPVLLDGVSEIPPIMLDENLPFAMDNSVRAVPKAKIVLAHRGGHHILDGYTATLFRARHDHERN